MVYAITATLYDHYDEWLEYYEGNRDYKPGAIDAAKMLIPFHPGAVNYFKERAWWEPANEEIQNEMMAEWEAD